MEYDDFYEIPLKNTTLTPEIEEIRDELMTIHTFRADTENTNRAVQQSLGVAVITWPVIPTPCHDFKDESPFAKSLKPLKSGSASSSFAPILLGPDNAPIIRPSGPSIRASERPASPNPFDIITARKSGGTGDSGSSDSRNPGTTPPTPVSITPTTPVANIQQKDIPKIYTRSEIDELVAAEWKNIVRRCIDYFTEENLTCGCGAIHSVSQEVNHGWANVKYSLFEQNPDHVDDYQANKIVNSLCRTLGKYRAWRWEYDRCDMRVEIDKQDREKLAKESAPTEYDMSWDKEYRLGEEKRKAFELKEKQDEEGDVIMGGIDNGVVERKSLFDMTDEERDEFIKGFREERLNL